MSDNHAAVHNRYLRTGGGCRRPTLCRLWNVSKMRQQVLRTTKLLAYFATLRRVCGDTTSRGVGKLNRPLTKLPNYRGACDCDITRRHAEFEDHAH